MKRGMKFIGILLKKRTIKILLLWLLIISSFVAGAVKFIRARGVETISAMLERDSGSGEKIIGHAYLRLEEVYATSHREELPISSVSENQISAGGKKETTSSPVPITNDIIYQKNIYVEGEREVILKSYYPNASEYRWEIYDFSSEEWKEQKGEEGCDELNRTISRCKIKCRKSTSPVMVRLTVTTPDQIYEEMCTVNLLEKRIIGVSAERYEVNADQYISSLDIPVAVTYEDGEEEIITGLYGLYWLSESQSSNYGYSLSGNQTKTITTVITEQEYRFIEMGEQDTTMHYRLEEEQKEFSITIEGKDLESPNILSLQLGEYQISRENESVGIPVTVLAADHHTLYTDLEYCFLPAGEEPEEEDWVQESQWVEKADRNGIWILYVRDTSGNIAREERELLVIDQSPPVIHEITVTVEEGKEE